MRTASTSAASTPTSTIPDAAGWPTLKRCIEQFNCWLVILMNARTDPWTDLISFITDLRHHCHQVCMRLNHFHLVEGLSKPYRDRYLYNQTISNPNAHVTNATWFFALHMIGILAENLERAFESSILLLRHHLFITNHVLLAVGGVKLAVNADFQMQMT